MTDPTPLARPIAAALTALALTVCSAVFAGDDHDHDHDHGHSHAPETEAYFPEDNADDPAGDSETPHAPDGAKPGHAHDPSSHGEGEHHSHDDNHGHDDPNTDEHAHH